jgi:hypothetical protein
MKPGKKTAPTVKAAKRWRSCDTGHADVKFTSERCPVCEAREKIDLLLAAGEVDKAVGEVDKAVQGMFTRTLDRLDSVEAKLSALDDAIAMLIVGPEQQCEHTENFGHMSGKCLSPIGHSGGHVYSAKRPS